MKTEDGQNIPFALYVDLSPSMDDHSELLSLIAMKMMKNGIKVLFGYNESILYQIDSISPNFKQDDFRKIISESLEYTEVMEKTISKRCKIKKIDEDINIYFKEKKARKVIIFSDFDAKSAIDDLSNDCETWWFCFNGVNGFTSVEEFNFMDLDGNEELHKGLTIKTFKGHFYNSMTLSDFVKHLKNIDDKKYEEKQRALIEGGIDRE